MLDKLIKRLSCLKHVSLLISSKGAGDGKGCQ